MDVGGAYDGKAVFLTGCTGFVGIGVLEKLLFATKASKVYAMIRPRPASKKGPAMSVAQRLDQVFRDCRFDRCRELGEARWAKLRKRVVPVAGDLCDEGLGLSKSDRATLRAAPPDIFVHSAADVRFDREFNEAVKINVRGSVQVLDLAQSLGCTTFVHVSTLYVNARESTRSRVMEAFYPLGFDAPALYARWEAAGGKLPESDWGAATGTKLRNQDGWPNTYTLTKSIGERVMSERAAASGIRLSLLRLGIVLSDASDQPGWYFGEGGWGQLTMGMAKRIITILPGDGTAFPDACPVDHCINAILASGAKLATAGQSAPNEPDIFHISLADYIPDIDIKSGFDAWVNYEASLKEPIEGVIRGCTIKFIQSDFQFWLEYWLRYDLPYFLLLPFSYLFPASLFGGFGNEVSKSTYLLNKCRTQFRFFLGLYERFLNTWWVFDTTRTRELFGLMDEKSQTTFNFDGFTVDKDSYFITSGVTMWYRKLAEYKAKNKLKNRKATKQAFLIPAIVLALSLSLVVVLKVVS